VSGANKAPRYTFDLVCPVCKATCMVETENREVPPRYCGDCLAEQVQIVELTIVRVEVQP
jgi:C4-type Zn-finger protein